MDFKGFIRYFATVDGLGFSAGGRSVDENVGRGDVPYDLEPGPA